MFPKLNFSKISSFVTEDEICVHFFEPIRTLGNEIWQTEILNKVCSCQQNHKHKDGSLLLLFSCDGLAVKILVPKGESEY